MNNQPHSLTRCLYALYCEPWLLTPAMHKTLCLVLGDHITGIAHSEAGRAQMFGATSWTCQDCGAKQKDIGPPCAKCGSVNVVESTAAPRALPLTLDGIGTITVDGVVGRKVDSMTRSSGVLDIMDVTEQARQFAVADEVKGVLLAIDSPGGTVTGVPEAAYALRQLSGAKPLVAYTDGLAASAGYWLASQADAIYAEASAQVGSIGVYQFLLDTSRQAELAGIKPMLFASGKYKGMGIEGLPLTPEQAQRIKDTVDIVFTWFKRDVALKRAVSDEDKQGQTFYAAEALTKNLIDRVGTRADALAELRAMIGTERK